jgi:hypothetical protein
MNVKWDKLSPRERDALVAEHVMGWHKGESWGGTDWFTKDNEYAESVFKWNPSENLADAWQVVEKLRSEFNYISLEIFPSIYYCTIDELEIRAETAPEAISLAALKSCGVDID